MIVMKSIGSLGRESLMCIATVYGVEHQPSANSAAYPFTMSLIASFADCRTLLYMESSAGAKTRGMYM